MVEGIKSVDELTTSEWPVECILCTAAFAASSNTPLPDGCEVIETPEFDRIASTKNPQGILAVAKIQTPKRSASPWTLALDGINDPGNLGTIIRIADWYGIARIVCSESTVDLFNPKVIQSTMGSFLRVAVEYLDLQKELEGKKVYATLLEGVNIRSIDQPEPGIILIGGEANGITPELLQGIESTAITIPGSGTTESLNAAIATAICCERLTG